MIVCSEHQNRTVLGSDQVNSGKNKKLNKQSHVKFWFNRKNRKLSHIYYLAVYAKQKIDQILLI